MTRPVAVILNDTATRYHHGCARVMRLLVAGLEQAGVTAGFRVAARSDWTRDRDALSAIRAAQVIVINGEGTLHDGAAMGARLLAVMDAAPGVPVALVNALWHGNPPDWSDRLRKLGLVAARDSRSAAEMGELLGHPVRWLPDLSLSAPADVGTPARAGLIVGDSVRAEKRRVLGQAAQRLGAFSLPTKTLSGRFWQTTAGRNLLWRAYFGIWSGSVPRFGMATSEQEYLCDLAATEGHVTGRFHGVCLSMLTETPFLALASTTSKVETLLVDAGLGTDRLISEADLARLTPAAARRPYSASEIAAIRGFREQATIGAARLFADIRELTR
jgi:hypothetical protein